MGIFMDNKTALVNFLSCEYGIDYWSDVAIEHAIELADAMSPSEWTVLCETWDRLEPIVQARVAEIASDVSSWIPDINQMLIAMLSSNLTDVVETSLDSLHAIYQRSPDRLNKENLKLALDGVSPKDRVVEKVLDSLTHKINAESLL